MTDLKPCPCGKTPEKLEIDGDEFWRESYVQGDCCGEWAIQYHNHCITDKQEENVKRATKAWNSATRGGMK